jgi:hypothetical protein
MHLGRGAGAPPGSGQKHAPPSGGEIHAALDRLTFIQQHANSHRFEIGNHANSIGRCLPATCNMTLNRWIRPQRETRLFAAADPGVR